MSLDGALPWCAGCDWNLDTDDARRQPPEFGWSRVDRRTYRLAARLTRRQYTALLGRSLEPAGQGFAGILVTGISVLLLLGVAGLAVAGVWLLFAYPFPNLAVVGGVALLALAVALRPRFGRLDRDLDVLTEREAPELHALVREVATAVSGPSTWPTRWRPAPAARRLLDTFLRTESVATAVRGGHGPDTWRVETGRALDAAAERLSLERQLTVREDTSLFATHPPTGLRHRMLGWRGRPADGLARSVPDHPPATAGASQLGGPLPGQVGTQLGQCQPGRPDAHAGQAVVAAGRVTGDGRVGFLPVEAPGGPTD
ncbi:hypothetical protein ACFFKH_04495 [Micromonospora marina]|uniref:Uncharacterized protein n=1 Tax=Micromonospora marina TaxID=307120 RepID=A0A1C5AJY8_9ACTN|nr:hypothetical protein [Micromonospora marina]SCF45527.1 hypothetical protein GA0070215_13519 [Micromonospora marina]